MRRISCIGFVMTLLAAGPVYAQTGFTVTLDESQVGGGTGSAATGMATLTLNAAADTLTYSITLVGVDLDGLQTPADPNDDVTAMHFHNAPAGSNGGVVFGLIAPLHDTDDLVINAAAGTLTGAWENTDTFPLSSQLANLNAEDLYLNVHTTSFPGGEIRGQVLLAPAVPTLGSISLTVLALLLAGTGFFALRRQVIS